MLCIGVVR